jgi:hypothetical protein
VTIFYCSACGTALTADLGPLAGELKVDDDHERDAQTRTAVPTVPSGFFALDPEPWGAPFILREDQENPVVVQHRSGCWATEEGVVRSAGPRNTVVLNPHDVAGLAPIMAASDGCCGPAGGSGPNLACVCRAAVATLAANCSGPYEVHLNPDQTHT